MVVGQQEGAANTTKTTMFTLLAILEHPQALH
jgi:hypothetical protein